MVVNHGVSVPRRTRRQIRTLLHLLDVRGDEAALRIVKGWTKAAFRQKPSKDLAQSIRGKISFVDWIDEKTTGHVIDSYRRGYPNLREIMPRSRESVSFRALTEGDTDALHLEAALKTLQRSGEFLNLKPRFKNYSGDNGDEDLLATLQRIAKSDVGELTIGIFDCDNAILMRRLSVEPGDFHPLSDSVFCFFLAPPGAESPSSILH